MTLFVFYVTTIIAANLAVEHIGIVPVGFGLAAPAGVYFVGLAFTLRDLLQDQLGKTWTFAAIAAGSILSYLSSLAIGGSGAIPEGHLPIAAASALAFLISETADFAVYTPLRERNWIGAVVASNTVGLLADSALFLYLAFGSTLFLAGQAVGKAWMTLAAIAALAALRHRRAQTV